MPGMAALALFFAGLIGGAVAQTTSSLGTAQPHKPSGGAYYIEFRVAQIGTYGHSYVMYGRLGGNGQPADRHYTDLHPMGNYALMAIGHVLPVPANTSWDPDVLKLPITFSYRRKLSAAEYQKLLAAIRHANANKQPYWNALTNNCNHYIAALARAIGMNAPNDLRVSYAFVPALKEMNEPPGNTTAAQHPRRKSMPAARTAAPAPSGT